MKHNYIPRILCMLLVMVMVSSIGVGFTYSKYIVDDRADDTSRVATFGVTTGVTAKGFAKSYKNSGGTVTVNSTQNVVAPGTSGTFSGINVQGTPEVAVKITTTADMELTNWTTDGSDYYCPITVTVNNTPYYGLNYNSMDEFEAAIEAAITTVNGDYDAGTNLSAIPGLNGNYSWEWAFKGTDGKQNTTKDTKLGARAAAGNAGTFSLTVTARVEQVD